MPERTVRPGKTDTRNEPGYSGPGVACIAGHGVIGAAAVGPQVSLSVNGLLQL